MKQKYENALEDRNFLEAQLKKAKKINKVLYFQQFGQKQKKLSSDSSLASMIKKDLNELSDKCSTEQLLIAPEENLHNGGIDRAIQFRRSHPS